jgi:hypothetical protein
MFFITKDGVKDWKEGDPWYKPSSVEGYEATSSPGMSPILKGFLIAFCAIILLYLFTKALIWGSDKIENKEGKRLK